MRPEAERQYYLQQAGVQLWYARLPLPGAAPSPEFDFEVSESAPVDNTIVPGTAVTAKSERSPGPVDRERGKGRINQLQALMAKPQAEATAQPERVPSREPVNSNVSIDSPEASDVAEPATERLQEPLPVAEGALSAATVERCCVQGWLGKRVAIIAYLSEQSSLSMQETLAQNILESLGDDVSATVGPVRWPLFNNLRVGLNHVTHLQGVLRDLFASCADKTVVSLGDAGNLLSGALGKPVDVQFASGLAALAGDPSLKRELWLQIKPLTVSR